MLWRAAAAGRRGGAAVGWRGRVTYGNSLALDRSRLEVPELLARVEHMRVNPTLRPVVDRLGAVLASDLDVAIVTKIGNFVILHLCNLGHLHVKFFSKRGVVYLCVVGHFEFFLLLGHVARPIPVRVG